MKPENFDIDELIQDLNGTCNSLAASLPEGMKLEDLTPDDHAKIDNEIFLCEECGWWCEVDEQSVDSDLCRDCYDSSLEETFFEDDEEEEE